MSCQTALSFPDTRAMLCLAAAPFRFLAEPCGDRDNVRATLGQVVESVPEYMAMDALHAVSAITDTDPADAAGVTSEDPAEYGVDDPLAMVSGMREESVDKDALKNGKAGEEARQEHLEDQKA